MGVHDFLRISVFPSRFWEIHRGSILASDSVKITNGSLVLSPWSRVAMTDYGKRLF